MNQTILTQTQKEFSEAERNIWIQEYVSRRENPIILVLYFILLATGAFFMFQNPFVNGSYFSFWMHLVGAVAIPIVLGIVHGILNAVFKKGSVRRCPLEATTVDAEALPDTNAMLAEYKRLKDHKSTGYDPSTAATLLSPVILILCFGYFAWLQKLPIPDGSILYLVILCVVSLVYGLFTIVATSQTLSLPLSSEVMNAITAYEKENEQRIKDDAERDEQERIAKELAEKRAQEAAEKAKLAVEANALYLKAVAEGNVDENLLYEAAEKGSVDALKHIGHLVLERMASPMYTEGEKAEYAEEAAEYLSAAADSDDGELKFLWYYARSVYEKTNMEGWQQLLDEIRALLASGTLPAKYEEECTTLVRDLVHTVDSIARKRAERDARPKHYRCRYCAGGICTLRSTSVTMITCNYVAHPENCSSNLLNRNNLEIVYDD